MSITHSDSSPSTLSRDIPHVALPHRDALDTLGCGVIGRDHGGNIRYLNDRILSWTHYLSEELVGRPLTCLIPPELDEIMLNELHSVDDGDLRARLTIIRRKDGTTFPVMALPQYQRCDDLDAIHCAVVIDLACMQTAKPADLPHTTSLRGSLGRITRELEMLSLLANALNPRTPLLDHPSLALVSPREREVLAHLLRGLRVKTIAKALHVSPHTVRNHLKAVFQKLDVNSQAELTLKLHSLTSPEC